MLRLPETTNRILDSMYYALYNIEGKITEC